MAKVSSLLGFWAVQMASYALAHQTNFDFIIVGGGTSGLVVANRLSELSNVSVAIIEAGDDVRDNVNVTDANAFSAAFGTPIDWAYSSTAQEFAEDRVFPYHAGKAIGGTSTINGMTYIRGQKDQVDAWEALGNKGWNWDSLFPYYKKSERFIPPTAAQEQEGASYEPQYHGFDGHLHVAFPDSLSTGALYDNFTEAWEALGFAVNPDTNSGDVSGIDAYPMTITPNPAGDTRFDAALAYYYPVAGRPNLQLFKGTATRIVWDSQSATATGVEYLTADETLQTLTANAEVVLSAGTYRTPALLELSGIGNPRILEKFGISTKVDLPAVGENFQDQTNTILAFGSLVNLTGIAPYTTFASAAEVYGPDASIGIAESVKANLTDLAAQIAVASEGGLNQSSIEQILQIQYDLVFTKQIPTVEFHQSFGYAAGATVVFSAFWPLMPFARGSIHIQSADPTQQPAINPNFFQSEFDLDFFAASAKLGRMSWEQDPLRNIIDPNNSYSQSTPPANTTDEGWKEYVVASFFANWHGLGSAAMMARELGGVVDSELKVYGTENVRVVDASILPLQLSGHLTSTLYAVAERASDIIKKTINNKKRTA